jgi:hypothetical protein
MKSAWSWQFDPDRLATAPGLALPAPITAEWAGVPAGAPACGSRWSTAGSTPTSRPSGEVAGGVALEYDPRAPGQVRATVGPHQDLFGHGTACAGIIRSLAPEAEL